MTLRKSQNGVEIKKINNENNLILFLLLNCNLQFFFVGVLTVLNSTNHVLQLG